MPLPPILRNKHVIRDWRAHVHGLVGLDWSTHKISAATGIPQKTVWRITKGQVKLLRQGNPPRMLPQADTERLAYECLMNPARRDQPFDDVAKALGINAPRAVIRRSLKAAGLGRFWRATKPKTSPLIRQKRLAFARQYAQWDIDQWRHVIFEDESAFRLGAGNRHVTRLRGTGDHGRVVPEATRVDALGSGRITKHVVGAINLELHGPILHWD
nr:hypothetical protein CFP56_30670 [Quercus suber]